MRGTGLIGLLLACAACGATGERRDAMKPTAELDLDRQEVIAAFREGGATWIEMRERVRDSDELAGFVVDNMIDQMIRSYDQSAVARTGEREGPFERARAELLALPEHAAPVLIEFLDADLARDTVAGFLASDVLIRIGAPALRPAARKLSSKNPETRRRTVELCGVLAPEATEFPDWTGGPEGPDILSVLAACTTDDASWVVRGEAARALGRRASRAAQKRLARTTLAQALTDPDRSVRGVAAQALGELGDPRGIPVLASYLDAAVDAGEPENVDHARASLIRLARDRFEHRDPRRFTSRDWRTYWERERERLLRAEKP